MRMLAFNLAPPFFKCAAIADALTYFCIVECKQSLVIEQSQTPCFIHPFSQSINNLLIMA